MGDIATRKSVVLAKLETTYGVDPIPSSLTDAVQILDDLNVAADGTVLVRNTLNQSFSQKAHVIGRKLYTVTFSVEVKGNGLIQNGNAANPIEVDQLLQACAMKPTYTAESPPAAGNGFVEYKPTSVSASIKSATLYVYNDGLLYKIRGAYGTVAMTGEAGNYGRMTFTFTGLYTAPVDQALVTPTFDSTLPVSMENASFTVHGFAAVAQAIEWALNNTVAERPSVNAPEGLVGLKVTGRDPNGSVNPEAELEATADFWNEWKTAEQGVMTFAIGTVAGNKFLFTAPKTQFSSIGWGDRDGTRTYEIATRFPQNVGDDEIVLKYS